MKFFLLGLIILFATTILFPQKAGDSFRLYFNQIDLPINNKGIIGNVKIAQKVSGGYYRSKNFLFSGGFLMSGYSNDSLWANGMADASRIEDYLPGIVNKSSVDDSNAVLYVVRSNDEPFGQSWKDWSNAVELGADFYDGDNDSLYNPEDKNSNGIWDPDEDAPDIIGDVNVWCVYNDGVLKEARPYKMSKPIGIEIRQTAFTFSSSGPLEYMIFLRYRIKYVGLNNPGEPDLLNDVYFGIWTDPDIGGDSGYSDDLVGCDIELNSGYAYNDGNDPSYGTDPPCFLFNLLAGPVEYIPGLTFNDKNSNGIFEDSIDEPIDTAIVMKGARNGRQLYFGAANQLPSSFVYFISGSHDVGDPYNISGTRNYMQGLSISGKSLNPCKWGGGNVFNADCSTINNKFWFSGDPATSPRTGWLDLSPSDKREVLNTGPFTLKKGEEKEIVTVYLIGQGIDALTSVTEAKKLSIIASEFFRSNFDQSVVAVNDKESHSIIDGYKLSQNYPNPFNPVTNIEFQTAEFGLVSLKVYDVLGREIAALVNEEKPAGTYMVNFDAGNLSSGIYFYKMKANETVIVKKMLILK